METTQNSFNDVSVKDFRTDVLEEMLESLTKQWHRIAHNMGIIEEELNRRRE